MRALAASVIRDRFSPTPGRALTDLHELIDARSTRRRPKRIFERTSGAGHHRSFSGLAQET